MKNTRGKSDKQAGLILPDRRPGPFKGKIGETANKSRAVFPITRRAPKAAVG